MKKEPRNFCNFLQANNIVCGVKEADGKVVLDNLIVLLKRHFPELDIDFTRQEIESREAIFPTMVAPGLAIPHARIPGLKNPLTAIACIPCGADFGTEDKAKVMILLLTPVDNPNLHIQLLSALAAEFKEPAVTDKIAQMGSAQEVMDYFSDGSAVIPDYLTAGDLIEKYPEMLLETDSILDAVKKFAVCKLQELPVIDDCGDLRGVLSLSDLLRYSLPEHLLWLEDLSPIYELQPFSDMLKTADETKVADIMREDFVKADINDPAVKLAKIFMMNNVSQMVIIGKDNKVAGMVTLENFSAKLFWE